MSDQDESRPQGIKLDRSFVSLTVGSLVCCQKEIFRITQVLDFQSVMGINVETGRAKLLQMADLKPVLAEKVKGAYINHDLEDITSEEWATAQMRYSVIAPLKGSLSGSHRWSFLSNLCHCINTLLVV